MPLFGVVTGSAGDILRRQNASTLNKSRRGVLWTLHRMTEDIAGGATPLQEKLRLWLAISESFGVSYPFYSMMSKS